jgi:WD40 repeat protein
LCTLQGHEGWVSSVTFSPDGTRLVSGSDDTTIRLWDTATGEELKTLRGHEGVVRSVTFSPDGTRLASGGYDTTIRLWDTTTGEEVNTFRGHEAYVVSVAFNPDGTRLVSGSNDRTVRLWDTTTGEALTTLRGHDAWVNSVTFNSDGTRLASASGDTTIRLWDTRSRGHIAHDRRVARQRAVQLTPFVEAWMEKTDGDSELVLAMLEREIKNRPLDEQLTLRNLVLKYLAQSRSWGQKHIQAAPHYPDSY